MKDQNSSTHRYLCDSSNGVEIFEATMDGNTPCFFEIGNNGARIVKTTYWQTELARRGFCWLSGNAGTWRLLVPPNAEHAIAEMRTGRRVTIEDSMAYPARCWDIVFHDGTASPFCLSLDKQAVDRTLAPDKCSLTVWTERGKVLTFECAVCCASHPRKH